MSVATVRKQRLAEVRGNGRQTIPAGFVAGVGSSPAIKKDPLAPRFISRRMDRDFGFGGNFGAQPGRYNLSLLAQSNPLQLITHLHELAPQVDFAINQDISLAIPEGGLPIVAVDDNKEINEEDTNLLDQLWKSLPDEIGGLEGLQATQFLVARFTGRNALEAVPAKRLEGVARIWPVDPLTLLFSREGRDEDITVWQKQNAGGTRQYARMNPSTFFWNSANKWVDDPWGHSSYGTVLAEILVDLAFLQDIRDSVKHNAWPRKAIPFNWESTYKIAREVMHITDPIKAKEFVHDEFNRVKAHCQAMQADEDWLYDASNGAIAPLPAGSYAGLEPIIKYFQQRVFWGCKKLPSMMGFGENTSESFSTLSWLVEARQLEKMRGFIMKPNLQAAQLHLELMGRKTTAVAKYDRLRTSDALIDAQTRSVEIQNELLLWANGLQSQDQVAVKLTGSKPVKAMDTPASMGNPNGNPAGGQGNAGKNPSGQTAQDQKASQNRTR